MKTEIELKWKKTARGRGLKAGSVIRMPVDFGDVDPHDEKAVIRKIENCLEREYGKAFTVESGDFELDVDTIAEDVMFGRFNAMVNLKG